ncbi:MAG: hypothetical protein LBT09_06650 [Planctomycetaceae bacterium]|jgi:hypothetical protein|nr:hypothetical protein [Planctomycetaceae bacterium]
MSTRAVIEFTNGNERFFVYRHFDGFPKNIIPKIEKAIREGDKMNLDGARIGKFVTLFLTLHNQPADGNPGYEIASQIPDDVAYIYSVEAKNEIGSKWKVSYRQAGDDS